MGRLVFDRASVGAVDTPEEMVDIPLEFDGQLYKCTCVSIGNPHCVILIEEISKEKVCYIGKYSGSSSCAAAGAVYRLGLTEPDINVHMPVGILKIEIDNEWNVKMTGDVVYVGKMLMPY